MYTSYTQHRVLAQSVQWTIARLSDVPQMDTSSKCGTEQGFDILSTILVSTTILTEPRELCKFEMAAKWPPSRNENFTTLCRQIIRWGMFYD